MEATEVKRAPPRPMFNFEEELQNDSLNHEVLSAKNPYNDADSYERVAPGATSSSDQRNLTLGQVILDRVGNAFKGVFRNSQTILRVDLRQTLRYDVPLRRASVKAKPTSRLQRPDPSEVDDEARGWLHGLQGGGARLKLMQIWEFKDLETGEERLPFNIGFGANVVMDRGEAEPKVRIRSKYAAFHFFPEPYLEIRAKYPLWDTNLAIRARYRIPVSSMRAVWEPQSTQFLVNVYHRSGRVFHLTPGGLEFEDPTIPFGSFGTMRLAASVDFPRQFPLQEGEQPFRLSINRLGLKSRIL